jgi:hypothetical protein
LAPVLLPSDSERVATWIAISDNKVQNITQEDVSNEYIAAQMYWDVRTSRWAVWKEDMVLKRPGAVESE